MGQLQRIGDQNGIDGPLAVVADTFLATSDFTDATRHVYRRTLQALIDDLEHDIGVDQVNKAAVVRHLKQRYGDATAATFNRNLATFRSFFDWCV